MSSESVHYVPEQPSTAMEVLTLFATSKEGIEKFSNQIITAVREGNVDPLRVAAYAKTLETIAEKLLAGTRNERVLEAAKYGENQPFQIAGTEMIYTSVKTDYDYSKCNDDVWREQYLTETNASLLRKEREAFLKQVKEPFDTVDKKTGEVITIRPPIKKILMGIKVTIKPEH